MIAERESTESLLKGRFIKKVLHQEGMDILQEQKRVMNQRSFTQVNKLPRSQKATQEQLTITNNMLHRFVDIKTRKTKQGIKKKKNHPIYNRIIYGRLNNIIRELSFGFTEAVKREMKSLED